MWEEVCMFLMIIGIILYGLFGIEYPFNLCTLPFAIFFFYTIFKKSN